MIWATLNWLTQRHTDSFWPIVLLAQPSVKFGLTHNRQQRAEPAKAWSMAKARRLNRKARGLTSDRWRYQSFTSRPHRLPPSRYPLDNRSTCRRQLDVKWWAGEVPECSKWFFSLISCQVRTHQASRPRHGRRLPQHHARHIHDAAGVSLASYSNLPVLEFSRLESRPRDVSIFNLQPWTWSYS